MPHNTSFEVIHQNVIVPESLAGNRLDQVLSHLFSDYSRSQLQKWLKQGDILVDGKIKKAKDKLIGFEQITLNVKLEKQTKWHAEDIHLDIVYEDSDIIVINKPIGQVVHPGAGNTSGTISNALLGYDPIFESIPRAGIVHRLDKDTSGLMVAAKTLTAHSSLVSQLSSRQVSREYEAIATGYITMGSTIKTKIGRSPHNRLKMAVTPTGKDSITHFTILERYRGHTRIRCKLETGRTHQIRVHMQHLRAPLVGDQLYNPRLKLPKGITEELATKLRQFNHQALHAYKLEFTHPVTQETVKFKCKPPKDFQELISLMRSDAQDLYTYNYDFDDFDDFDEFDDFDDFDDFDGNNDFDGNSGEDID